MKLTARWHGYCLGIMAIAINLTTLWVLTVPTAGNQPVAEFKFPENFPLSSGKTMVSLKVKNLSNTVQSPGVTEESEIIQGQHQYLVPQSEISLDISYLINTRGDVAIYLQKYTAIAPTAIAQKQVKDLNGMGEYFLLTDGERAYLSSCISPRSLANVTPQKFSQYRYQNDLKLSVIWDWLQGKASIRDRRCLWVNLATPILTEPATAYQVLEKTWQDVYPWWLSNFPEL